MSPWTLPSLLPLLVLSGALGVGLWWRAPERRALALHCLSLTAWSGAILLSLQPATEDIGQRLLMLGFFVPATYLHAAAQELRYRTRAVHACYAVGAVMLASSLAVEGLFLAEGGSQPGVLFWPMFGLSGLVGVVPLLLLAQAPERGQRRRYLLYAGLTTHFGGALNNLLTLSGAWSPVGLYVMLLSIGLLTYAIRAAPGAGRFVERSQRYALLAALLSGVWMFGLLVTVGGAGWSWPSLVLLFVLTLTVQPLYTELRSVLAGWVFPGQADAEGLSRALAASEARAEHAERLAELGVLTSAVAHEVRNPLGVIQACVALLERDGADAETLDEIRTQVDRAATFAGDLLEYGRPAPLRVRALSLADAATVAASEGERSGIAPVEVQVDGDATLDGDVAQLVRLFGTLYENAGLAGATRVQVTIRGGRPTVAEIDDDGPGLPEQLTERVFEPFVSGRGREGPRPGTGLGLAIARGVAERHRGALRVGEGSLGGACFVLELPPTLPREED